jgi:hypothetical protein
MVEKDKTARPKITELIFRKDYLTSTGKPFKSTATPSQVEAHRQAVHNQLGRKRFEAVMNSHHRSKAMAHKAGKLF